MDVANIKDPNVKILENLTEKMTLSCKEKSETHDVKDRLTPEETLNNPWLNECRTYKTECGSRYTIDDSIQVNSSCGKFHYKYKVKSIMYENKSRTLFGGKNKIDGRKVVIKREQFKDSDLLKRILKKNMPREVYVQKKAEALFVQKSPYKVLEVLDWYVYDNYVVIVTKYDKGFKDLYRCTRNQDDKHFSEEDCKSVFKMLLRTVSLLNKNGIFHLDLKPANVLYETNKKALKLIDFGISCINKTNSNPLMKNNGTRICMTPQQIKGENSYGRDVDLWGIAQTIYFCLQGSYASQNYSKDKKLKYEVKVSKECENLLTKMLAHDVEDRLTPDEILDHPWLNEKK